MSNSRLFGQTSGTNIETALGDIPTNLVSNDFTAVVVFRRSAVGNGRGLLLAGTNTGGGECFGMWISSNERLFTNVGDGWDFNAAAVASLTETWYLGAMTKGSIVRVHLGNLEADTWGHGDPGTSIDPTTLDKIVIGNRTPSPASFDGEIAFAAIFEEELTDQEIEDLAAGVQASLDAGATAAWLLNQSDVGDPVLDLVGDADQTSITGTAVSSETPEADGFSYSLAGGENPSSASDGPSITLSIAGTVVKRAASAASLDLSLDASGDDSKSGQAASTLGLDLDITATGEATEEGPAVAEIPLQLGIAGTVTKRVSANAALSLALDLAGRPLTGPAYSFFPPTIMEAPIARAPERRLQQFFDRLRLERGVSVVRDGAGWKEVRYVVPEQGWVEGEDYFVGGHHYVIPRELATELIDAGYQPQLIEETS